MEFTDSFSVLQSAIPRLSTKLQLKRVLRPSLLIRKHRNWEYFLKRDVHEYRLDGNYLFMYHGGINVTKDSAIPFYNNSRYVNKDVYEALRSRKISDFVDKPFEFNI